MAPIAGSRTELTTPSEVEFQLKHGVDAPREPVWDLFTKPEHLTQWLLGPDGWSMPVCESIYAQVAAGTTSGARRAVRRWR